LTLLDLRPAYFGGLNWYETLAAPAGDEVSAWRVAKSQDAAWRIDLLNAGLSFASSHGLQVQIKSKFARIRAQDLLPEPARAEMRLVSFPIWEVANEVIVAAYLERVLQWELCEYEPVGRGAHLGDWTFRTRSGRYVFVEVKSLAELGPGPNAGTFTRGDYSPRLRQVLSHAYQQLPADDRAVAVVLVGDWLLEISHGILLGDLFAALFGKYQIRFKVMTDAPHMTYAGPSFRDMLVHGSKHRRLGTVGGLITRGLCEPRPLLYFIDNPYAYPAQRLPEEDLEQVHRFVVDDGGRGLEKPGIGSEGAWGRMRSLAYPDDT
jgi:hypothetical protein